MRASSSLRSTFVAASACLIAAGFVLAARGSGAEGAGPGTARGAETALPALAAEAGPPSFAAPALAPTETATPDAGPSPPDPTAPPDAEASATATATPARGTEAPALTPAARPVVPASPSVTPITDLPRLSALDVLGRAGSVVLPSGRSYRACVELPGEGPWPTPVHLYWLGGGRWRVETHNGDAGLIFDEATETFRVAVLPARPTC